MKIFILLFFALAGFALSQSLPYQYAYKNERGWKEMMVFEQSPNNPNVIMISLYSYIDAEVPYYKLKETKPAGDKKKVLAFIAQHQANDQAIARAKVAANAEYRAQAAEANAERNHREQMNAIQEAREEARLAAQQAEIDRQAQESGRIMRMRD